MTSNRHEGFELPFESEDTLQFPSGNFGWKTAICQCGSEVFPVPAKVQEGCAAEYLGHAAQAILQIDVAMAEKNRLPM